MRRAQLFAPRTVSIKKQRGRSLKPRPAGPKCCLRGEACPYAVLTENLVRRIRRMHVPNQFGALKIVRVLAGEGLTLNVTTVNRVLQRETWAHVK